MAECSDQNIKNPQPEEEEEYTAVVGKAPNSSPKPRRTLKRRSPSQSPPIYKPNPKKEKLDFPPNPLLRRCSSEPFNPTSPPPPPFYSFNSHHNQLQCPNAASPASASTDTASGAAALSASASTLCGSVSDPKPSSCSPALKPISCQSSSSSSSGDEGDDDTPNSKRLKMIKDRVREKSLWFQQVMLENEDDDEEEEEKVELEPPQEQHHQQNGDTTEEIIRILPIMPGQDRISQLPNPLLPHILSFLPIQDVVATTILSTRWHNIWTRVTVIDVDNKSIPVDDDQFYTIVDSILRHPMADRLPLDKFILKCKQCTSHVVINNLIQAALDRQVKELELCTSPHDRHKFPLPVEVYRNQNLKVLKLSGVRIHDYKPPGSFPSLKSLHVDISRLCDESLQNFYNHCPVLEELRMEGELDEFPDVHCHFVVSSESLKALYIKLQSSHGIWDDAEQVEIYTFKIKAKNLEGLFINEDILADYQMEELTSLVKGDIQIGLHDCLYIKGGRIFFNEAFKVMRGLSRARTLTLGERTTGALGYAVHSKHALDRENEDHEDGLMWDDLRIWDEEKVWELCRGKIPEFHQLKILRLSIGNRYGWNLLPYLLIRFFPRLETLRLEMVYVYGVDPNNRFAWNPPLEKPTCLMETIIRVEVKGFRHEDGEGLPLINYLQQISSEIREFQIIIE